MVLKNYLSRISKFSKLAKIDKKRILSNQANIPIKKLSLFLPEYGLDSKTAGCMIENNIGVFGLPIGVVLNFVLNKKCGLVLLSQGMFPNFFFFPRHTK